MLDSYDHVLFQLQTWVVAPYKKPERYEPDNSIFNEQVSNLRIRSEHAIGFLKGRFHSLKNLRLSITDTDSHQFATFWVTSCIGIHSFAMQCELEERNEDDWDVMQDPFIVEGLDDDSSDEDGNYVNPRERLSQARLRAGRDKRRKLKERLFRARERRTQRRQEFV